MMSIAAKVAGGPLPFHVRRRILMRTHFYRSLTSSAVALLLLLSLRGSALADAASALRCQQTINRELAKFVKNKSRILRVCKEKSIKKGVPSNPVECPLPAQDDQINAAAQKMLAKIAVRACQEITD
jgi:hypothetical protein